jgi:hypothetical protein
VHGSHIFQISGYSRLHHREQRPTEHRVRASSAVFAVGGHDWQIHFFPGGIVDVFDDHVAAYLVLKNGSKGIRVSR